MSLMARGESGSEKKRKNPTAGHRPRDCLGSYFSREICAGWEKGGGSSQPLPGSVLAASMAGPVVGTKSVVTAPVPRGFPVGWEVWMEAQLYLGPGDIPLLLCPGCAGPPSEPDVTPGGAARCFSLESGTNRAAAGGNTHLWLQVWAGPGWVMLARGV